jgi:hypothetical protein
MCRHFEVAPGQWRHPLAGVALGVCIDLAGQHSVLQHAPFAGAEQGPLRAL